MRYKNDIEILVSEFEDDRYKFQIDDFGNGDRIRIRTASHHSIDGYINILDNYNVSTGRANICVNQSIVDILKKKNPDALKKLIEFHDMSSYNQMNGHNKWVSLHKTYYSLDLIRNIIDAVKSDYFALMDNKKSIRKPVQSTKTKNIFKPKKKNHSHLLQQKSKLGRITSEKSIKRNLDKGYTADWWPFVQDEARINAEMKCQCCGVTFKIDTAYECSLTKLRFKDCFPLYHVHHKDRNTKNNNPTNLEALCLTCHSFEAGTGHEKFRTGQIKYRGSFPEYVSNILHHRILNQMRRQQGIDITFDIDFETLQRKQKIETVVSDKAQKVIQRQSGIIEKQEGLIERLISLIKRTVA